MGRTLVTIQYLRAVSAVLVVLFHVGLRYRHHLPVGEGRVSLFFIVSGFILWWITSGAKTSPTTFLLRRVARMVPLYWLVTWLLGLQSVLNLSQHEPITAEHFIKSLLFIPHLDTRPGGGIWPVLVPGWTLVYEMFFCILFAALLYLPERKRLVVATVLFGGLGAAGFMFRPEGPLAATYTNQIMLEFLAGIWLAAIWRNGALSTSVAASILVGGIVMSWAALPLEDYLPAVLYSGGPALIMIIGALGLERPGAPPIRWLKRIGDSSYSIYLWHIPVIIVGGRAYKALGLDNAVFCIVTLTVASVVAGLILYELLERPLTEGLFKLIDSRRSRVRPAGLPSAHKPATPSEVSVPKTPPAVGRRP
ncbi:MAG: exopolysaccharide biosynthesis protein [Phenylobacterium sp.]|nr:exopolysaccharide biosynthesis protein [Phenylobacterium sp.]